jgi:hypothetical protein
MARALIWEPATGCDRRPTVLVEPGIFQLRQVLDNEVVRRHLDFPKPIVLGFRTRAEIETMLTA